MGRKASSLVIFLLVISFLVFSFEVKQASLVEVRENGDCDVRVLPNITEVDLHQTFTIAVVFEGVSNISGFDVRFSWDTTYLDYIDHTATVPVEDYPNPQPPSPYGGFLHTPRLWLKDDVDTSAGTYWGAFATLGGPGFFGNGTAFTMTFWVKEQELWAIDTILDITSASCDSGFPIQPTCWIHDGIVRVAGSSPGEIIRINSDGSIAPPTANLTTTDNVTYTFTDHNNASLVVMRDSTIVDGAGHILQRSTPSGILTGVILSSCTNVTVKNLKIMDFDQGFGVGGSHNTFVNNDISYSGHFIPVGFSFGDSHSNLISGNNITGFWSAFSFDESSENIIVDNTIKDVEYCAFTGSGSSSNLIYHNNFINVSTSGPDNPGFSWDNGYPSGGNYWSLYTGVDSYSGVYQNETGSDGIQDTPLVLGPGNRDRYPFNTRNGWENHPFSIESNTTITDKLVSPSTMQFNVSGPSPSIGYINITMPIGLNSTAIKVKINGTELVPPPFPIITSNGSHYFVYFEFSLSSHHIAVQYATGDIAVTEVVVSRTILGQGYSLLVNATLMNLGDFNTTTDVLVQANFTIFGNQTGLFIPTGTSVLVSFVWDTASWSIGNFTLEIVTTPCEAEGNLSNNILTFPIEVCVTIPGDMDGDFDVDIFDIVQLASRYGEILPPPIWPIPIEDIDGDGDIDIFDVVIASGNYGESI
jgi:hypothetical protein